jgi:D-alanyl-D-alanine carboxypeptidase (penicillin-binding protein 5/6)
MIALTITLSLAFGGAVPAQAAPSPTAPNPHPPLGGVAPDGSVPGGARLASRGVIQPAGSPHLPKNLPAKSWILFDLDSGAVLAARDPHGKYQPASILKTLTAVTLLPKLPGTRAVTISKAAAGTEGSAVGLLPGARYTVDQLFSALMLISANDAAMALAEANGGAAKTVGQMNQTARALGAYDTLAQTPSGLDGWQQLTSSYDMALFLRAAIAQPRFVKYDQLRSASFPPKKSSQGAVGGYEFDNQSSNFLDTVPGAIVAKTGYTDAALHTYAAAAEQGGRRLGVVFLRNQRVPLDQFQQAAALLQWGFRLKPTIAPVGRLAGPIAVAPTSEPTNASTNAPGPLAPTPSTATGRPALAAAGSATRVGSGSQITWIAAVAVSCLIVLGGGVVGLRLRKLRRLRRPR